MLLIYPPVTKGCEPPGGIPILGAALKSHNIPYKILDMNIGGQNFLLDKHFAIRPKKEHYRDLIRSPKGYSNLDRYTKVINELNLALKSQCSDNNIVTLANYTNSEFTPLRSKDLIQASIKYKKNTFYEYYKKTLPNIIRENNVKHIGISIQFLNQAICSFALIGYIKANYPSIDIILGGGLITSWGKSSNWKNPFTDIVDKIIIGPGEIELLKYLGYDVDISLLLNEIPDYDFNNNDYFSPGKIVPISGSIGCSWKKCTFCPEVAEDNKFIPLATANVINKMAQLKTKYSPSLFHFLDNEISPALLKAIVKSYLDTPWYGFTKFYSILKNIDFCRSLKKSGCLMLKLGLESGDQNVLDSMNKGIKLVDVEIILNNLKNAGIKTFIYLLFGTPEEDLESAIKTKNFVLNHLDCITYMNLAIFNLPVESQLAKELITSPFSDADLTMYSSFKHPKGWDRDKIRLFLDKEFRANSGIKQILKRSTTVFNANHSAFLK